MRIGYRYLGAVWPSVSDCEEISLSVYQEKLYTYAMRKLMEGREDWLERTRAKDIELKSHRYYGRHWATILIMD